ncbi:MAG: HEAT repeat domain-containing protein [Candidatus Aenigmarchaeota archaeon]|nr:HEAT repeat domain-containing protein [Candidatus Aenigmarchaeota archaeon]
MTRPPVSGVQQLQAAIAALQAGAAHERIYALKLLGSEGGSDRVRQAIIAALHHDPDPIVRHEAAFWLGELGDPEATDALAHALRNDPASIVRHEAAEALGWIPTTASRRALEAALQDPDQVVRKTAQISLSIHEHPRERWERRLRVAPSRKALSQEGSFLRNRGKEGT